MMCMRCSAWFVKVQHKCLLLTKSRTPHKEPYPAERAKGGETILGTPARRDFSCHDASVAPAVSHVQKPDGAIDPSSESKYD